MRLITARNIILIIVFSLCVLLVFFFSKKKKNDLRRNKQSIAYVIKKQDDSDYNNENSKNILNDCYGKMYNITGELLFVFKHISDSADIKVVIVAYYLNYNSSGEKTVSKMQIKNIGNQIFVRSTQNVEVPISVFAGVCIDQYFNIMPYDDILNGSYSLTFVKNENTISHISVIVSDNGRRINSIKTSCDEFLITDYLKLIKKQTQL